MGWLQRLFTIPSKIRKPLGLEWTKQWDIGGKLAQVIPPVATTLMGMGPYPGIGISTAIGGELGREKAKKAGTGQLGGTLMGAGKGFAWGQLGSSLGAGAKALMSPQGLKSIGEGQWAPTTGWDQFKSGFTSQGAGTLMGMGQPGGMGVPGVTPGAAGAGNVFNLKNLSTKILGGAALMGASAMMKPPTVGTRPDIAKEAVYSPNLVEARSMMRDLAMVNPSELANDKDVQKFIDDTVAQSEKAYVQQRKIIENNLAAQGKVAAKSGGAQYVLSEFDKNYQAGVQSFIAETRKSIFIAGINRQVKAVASYFEIAEREALQLLESYGYIEPQAVLDYQRELADYQGAQQMMGTMGGMMLESGLRRG